MDKEIKEIKAEFLRNYVIGNDDYDAEDLASYIIDLVERIENLEEKLGIKNHEVQ